MWASLAVRKGRHRQRYCAWEHSARVAMVYLGRSNTAGNKNRNQIVFVTLPFHFVKFFPSGRSCNFGSRSCFRRKAQPRYPYLTPTFRQTSSIRTPAREPHTPHTPQLISHYIKSLDFRWEPDISSLKYRQKRGSLVC